RYAVRCPTAAFGFTGLTGADGDVLDDYVMGREIEFAANEGNARIGRGLTGNGQIGVFDRDRAFLKIDDPADLKHNNTRAFGFDGFTEGTGAGGIEVGDLKDT